MPFIGALRIQEPIILCEPQLKIRAIKMPRIKNAKIGYPPTVKELQTMRKNL